MWWKKNLTKANPDRIFIRKGFAERMYIIEQSWPKQNQQLFGNFLAIDWRMFLLKFGSTEKFESLNRHDQLSHLNALFKLSANMKSEADRLRPISSDASFEALCQHFSAEFISNYVICLIERDLEWRAEISSSINPWIGSFWQLSVSVFPVNNSSLDCQRAALMM